MLGMALDRHAGRTSAMTGAVVGTPVALADGEDEHEQAQPEVTPCAEDGS